MDHPELYIKDNGMQRKGVKDILNRFLEKMNWEPNEIILDVGCGPGDVTSEIIFSCLKNKIVQLVGIDKLKQMIEYAENTYGIFNSKMNFEVLDIENASECKPYSCYFNKIFSFFCFHWIHKDLDALVNMHQMLKTGGEMLVHFMLINPLFELYECLDTEWQKYVEEIKQNMLTNLYSPEEVEAIFIKAGFQIIHIESSVKKFTYPDFSSLLNALRSVDYMYNVLPTPLHSKYSIHVKEKICEKQMVDICSTTGKTTKTYRPITVHAIKK